MVADRAAIIFGFILSFEFVLSQLMVLKSKQVSFSSG